MFLYFVLGTSLLSGSTVAFTYLKVKSAKCILFTSGGLGLVILVLVLRIRSCLHHCPPLVGGAWFPLPKNPNPLSALIFSPSGLIQQHLPAFFIFPNAYRGLDKNTGSAHFRSQRIHYNAGFCIKNIQKKFRGSRPPDPRGGRGYIVHTHPRAHLPDAGAPPFILGWLRPSLSQKFNYFLIKNHRINNNYHMQLVSE